MQKRCPFKSQDHSFLIDESKSCKSLLQVVQARAAKTKSFGNNDLWDWIWPNFLDQLLSQDNLLHILR